MWHCAVAAATAQRHTRTPGSPVGPEVRGPGRGQAAAEAPVAAEVLVCGEGDAEVSDANVLATTKAREARPWERVPPSPRLLPRVGPRGLNAIKH